MFPTIDPIVMTTTNKQSRHKIQTGDGGMPDGLSFSTIRSASTPENILITPKASNIGNQIGKGIGKIMNCVVSSSSVPDFGMASSETIGCNSSRDCVVSGEGEL